MPRTEMLPQPTTPIRTLSFTLLPFLGFCVVVHHDGCLCYDSLRMRPRQPPLQASVDAGDSTTGVRRSLEALCPGRSDGALQYMVVVRSLFRLVDDRTPSPGADG
jgi:hypothetical protein